jgi:lipoprotein LprG
MKAHFDLRLLLLVLLAALPAACRPSPEPEISPETIVANAVTRLNEMAGFHFALETTGPAAYLDADGVLALRHIEGDFVAPDRVRAVVRVAVPGLVTEVRVIGIGEQQWQTNVLTGAWELLPPEWGFNPAVLFDETVGLPAILAQDLTDLAQAEPETVDGQQLTVITAVITPDQLAAMSGGLMATDPTTPIPVRLWIAPDSYELHRIVLTEPIAGSDEPRRWQVDFSQFDQTVTIEPPE